MATIKAEKLKEDAYRANLENGIKALLASQEESVKAIKSLATRIKALEEKVK